MSFPLVDILMRFGDIRVRSLQLSEVDPLFPDINKTSTKGC